MSRSIPVVGTGRNPCNRSGCPHGAWFDKLTNRSRNHQDGVPTGTPKERAGNATAFQAFPSPHTGRTQLKYHTKNTIKVAHSDLEVTIPLHGANSTQVRLIQQSVLKKWRDCGVTIPLHGANSTQVYYGAQIAVGVALIFAGHNPLTRGELNSSE